MKIDNSKRETEIRYIFSTIKKVYGSEGRLILNKQSFDIKNINVETNNNISGYFELLEPTLKIPDEICDIEFYSDNDFKINIKCKAYRNFNIIKFVGLSMTCTRGKCNNNEPVRFLSFVENLKIKNAIYDFETKELDGVQLILYKNNFLPEINGYFYKESDYSNKETTETIWESLYFLIKLYSAGQAFNNISCVLSDNYCEISISRSNLNFVKNHYSCFYVNEKDNLLNFIKSSYPAFIKEKDRKIAFYSFIHYMSLLNGNNYDFDLIASFVSLEILSVGNGILLDDDTFLQNRLDELLDDYRIDKKSLNEFFKEDLEKLEHDDYLRCLIYYRNKILHGIVVDSHQLSLLINTFLTLILLIMLNINCSIYLPILDEVWNSKEFADEFKREIPPKTDNEFNNNVVELFKNDNVLYLPLTLPVLTPSIQPNARYRIITFKTLGNNGKCLRNIKIDKR